MTKTRRYLSSTAAFVATVLVAASLAFGASIIFVALKSSADRAEICEFIDAEHNQARALIVKQEREIYHPPATQPNAFREFIEPFIDTAEERQEINRVNKEQYDAIRKTRPDYCAAVRENPVPPYPTPEEFQKGK